MCETCRVMLSSGCCGFAARVHGTPSLTAARIVGVAPTIRLPVQGPALGTAAAPLTDLAVTILLHCCAAWGPGAGALP
jgi:hypothetical protein